MTTTPPSTPIPGMPDPEALKKQLEADDPVVVDTAKDPKAQEEYVFEVDLTFADGKNYKGSFKNKILSPEDKVMVSLLASKLSRGAVWETIDPDGQFLILAIAHLTYSLIEKPNWFTFKVKQIGLLNHVYEEVTRHEVFFRGPHQTPPGSKV